MKSVIIRTKPLFFFVVSISLMAVVVYKLYGGISPNLTEIITIIFIDNSSSAIYI